MIIIKPTLAQIKEMREIVRPQVESGVILERSEEVMANMIRSYRVAFEEAKVLESNKKLVLESKGLEELENPQMLGFCALHIYSSSLAEIRSLIVRDFAQNRGVGSALIMDCEREARELGIKNILVLTYKNYVFEKLGFREISKDKIPNQKIWADCIACKHFPQCDEIALIKDI